MDGEILFYPLGDRAVVITLGHKIDLPTHLRVKQLFDYMSRNPFAGMIELVPTYTALTLYYEPCKLIGSLGDSPYETVCHLLRTCVSKLASKTIDGDTDSENTSIVRIPVCYDDEFGTDLAFVAKHNALEKDEVIRIHTEGKYVVNMIGFVPGFPYLAGMSHRIAAPRKETPRQAVAAGSVGIAGLQTGIYPLQSPGGWQIIGRTPLTLFQPLFDPPSVLQFGDAVRFYPISRETFDTWGEKTT